jgi:predicted Fe-Mo cluster-binding NifX family protein
MKIAVPTADGVLCSHFGHCERFAIIQVDPQKKEIIASEMLTPPPHEPGVLPSWLSQVGCNLIIAGGMGMRAIDMFKQYGVEVLIGAPNEKPDDIVRAYLNGTLQTGENVCDH